MDQIFRERLFGAPALYPRRRLRGLISEVPSYSSQPAASLVGQEFKIQMDFLNLEFHKWRRLHLGCPFI